uniref:Pigment-dispersing factor II n=2 Tax=Peripatopsidae TaxID=27567 RepID=A0A0D3QT52_EUPRO|nr:pigment-dispersing factor II precursor [Euperipatoides rowelli]AJR16750.1 pigment-dispersing factor II precursor [Phallocephale tallagandensis]
MKSVVFAICLIIFAVVLVSINAEYGQDSEYDTLASKLLSRVLAQKRNAELINSLLNLPQKLQEAGK